MSCELVSKTKSFDCSVERFRFQSKALGDTKAHFHVIFPPCNHKVPVLIWLSGLTCTDENFIIKASPYRYAKQYNVALVVPDTSPRGDEVDEFGKGAGFYVNATVKAYSKHYNMYDFISKELLEVISTEPRFTSLLDTKRMGIFGHSMGGMGALQIAIKNRDLFHSVSAFAPISNPVIADWGKKYMSAYLGPEAESVELWKQYDPTELIKMGKLEIRYDRPILIDQGDADSFLPQGQLNPQNFVDACRAIGQHVELRMQPGYDHGYLFIQTFIEDHIKYHAEALYN